MLSEPRSEIMSGHERSRIVGIDSKQLQEFVCGICQDILNDPIATQCCRQSYCKQCIDDWLKKQKTCPNDRKPMTSNDMIQVPRLVVNLIDNMKIKCRYKGKGCDEVMTIRQLATHEIQCLFGHCKVCGSGETGEDHDCIAYLMNENMRLNEKIVNLESPKISRRNSKLLKSLNHDLKQKVDSLTFEVIRLTKELGDKKNEVINVMQVLHDSQQKLTKVTKELVDKKQELNHVKTTLTTKINNLNHKLDCVMNEKVKEQQLDVILAIEDAKNTEMTITFNRNIRPDQKTSFAHICLQAITDFSRERHNSYDLVKSIMTKIDKLPKKVRMNIEWQVEVNIETFVPDIDTNYNYILKLTWDTLAIYIYA